MAEKKTKLNQKMVVNAFNEFATVFEPYEAKHPFVYTVDQRTGRLLLRMSHPR